MREVVGVLAADGLVELLDDPAHARSRLVRATARGEALVAYMDAVDDRVLAAAAGGRLPRRDLEVTARTLRAMREAFEHAGRWRRALPAVAPS